MPRSVEREHQQLDRPDPDVGGDDAGDRDPDHDQAERDERDPATIGVRCRQQIERDVDAETDAHGGEQRRDRGATTEDPCERSV